MSLVREIRLMIEQRYYEYSKHAVDVVGKNVVCPRFFADFSVPDFSHRFFRHKPRKKE